MINRSRILLVIFPLAVTAGFATPSTSTDSHPPVSAAPALTEPPAATSSPLTYISVKGDSFTSVSEKFSCTIRALKKLNGITATHLKPGTVLRVPAQKVASSKNKKNDQKKLTDITSTTSRKARRHSPIAQPVQDFDVSPSTFASCPPPPAIVASSDDYTSPGENNAVLPPSAPVAEDETPVPGDPARLTYNHHATLLPVPNLPVPIAPKITMQAMLPPAPASITSARQPTQTPLPAPATPKKTLASAIANFFGGNDHSSESGAWGNRFLVETRSLASQGICYDGAWRPDGDSHRWAMDCSNTTRYLYQVTAGITLPRTASDQYYYLHLQDKAWDVPMTTSGFADTSFLRSNLKPGDLLFWENTYRPERQPPITHVMIFLGMDARGRWIMAGSQGGKGFYNRRHSGPDVYVFDPTHYSGGYTTWMGLVRHRGRFVAYGRPLEADVKKLSVAAND